MSLSRISIKNQLFLIVTIIAVPAICIIVYSGIQQRRAAIHDAEIETRKLAETIVSEQKNLVASTRQLFIALSQLPEITLRKQVETQSILSEILRLSPQYSNIFIAEPSGAVWVSAVPISESVSVADRRYFKNALTSSKLSSGEYHISRTSKKPTLNFGYALKDNAGKVTAVIVAGLSLDHYRHVFDAHNLPKGASFALLDHQGVILTRAIDPEKHMGKPSNPEIFKYMLEGPEEETSIGTSSVAGDKRIQTYRKLRLEGESLPYMYIRAGIPVETVMSETNAALARNLVVFSVSLLCAFFVSWLLGKKYIIDRVTLLQRSSQRLANGDLSTRVAHEVGGGEIGKLAQSFDDMAQKLARREQALRESESNYRGIFNTTHDSLFVNDEFGRITEANRSSERMFGYSREELLRLSVADLISGEPPYSFSEALKLIETALKEGTQEFEWSSKRKNGETFWTEIAITPTSIFGERRILAVIRDITERKQMEHLKEEMLSSISHEMRTPLTAMLGFLEFVIENQVAEAHLKEYHLIMHKEGERLNEMITNFLDMQRLKAKQQDYNLQPLDVKPLVDEVIAVFNNPSARNLFHVEEISSLPAICGDRELLQQALRNLLSNAIKYSPDGSQIIVDARLDDNHVTLMVKDNGIGIPHESLDKIFDMFYRVDNGSKMQIIGTGLGLSLVKEIAGVHNGRVWAESMPGEGSTFYISIPIARS